MAVGAPATAAEDAPWRGYQGCSFEAGYFDRYPINLRSIVARGASAWANMRLEQVLHSFTTWTIETHFRVAMQKLADSPPRDTFKVRPFDGELRVVDAPGAPADSKRRSPRPTRSTFRSSRPSCTDDCWGPAACSRSCW